MELTKEVWSAVLPQRTAAPWRNPLPFTVSVKPGPQDATTDGLIVVTDALPPEIVNVAAGMVKPHGLTIVMFAVPGVAIRLAGTAADNWVAPRNVVWSAAPFHRTSISCTNPVPVNVIEKDGPPARATSGVTEVTSGRARTNGTAFEIAPLGRATVIITVEGAVARVAGTFACNCTELTNMLSSVVFAQRTVAPLMNPEPVTTILKLPLHAVAMEGNTFVTAAPEPTTVTVNVPDVAPQGVAAETNPCPGTEISAAGNTAASRVEETKVVWRMVLFHRTVVPGTKLKPSMISVSSALPAEIVPGVTE
ncbi:hypothetical protein EG829_29060, partial [bacterium]|nr:hypothetical protein [bacterium]